MKGNFDWKGNGLGNNTERYLIVVSGLFCLILGYFFVTWPIVGYDTDLWYHLSGGRYLFQHGVIPHDAYFSYIEPPKFWYNYYWLFQAVVYIIHQFTGYHGLIVLRCLLYLATVLMVHLLMFRRNDTAIAIVTGAALFVFLILGILNRELLVRPHLFSYLFIVSFLYILEVKPDKAWILPIIGVIWCNVHGIEFPVMFAIVIAYLAESYYLRYKNSDDRSLPTIKSKILLMSVLYTVFFTPQIIKLLQTPFDVSFNTAAYQHLYVSELVRVPFARFFIFSPVTAQGVITSFQNVIVILAAASFFIGLLKRNLRISHAVLCLTGVFLLTQHRRFLWEFMLLCIPLLYRGLPMICEGFKPSPRFIRIYLPIVMIFLPVVILINILSNRPAYPLSNSKIPTGVVHFLNLHAPGGKILNEPTNGGYLEWALDSKFKIYMDMQMTIFHDTDYALAYHSFVDEHAFKGFLQKYDPSFISVSLQRSLFSKIISGHKEFVPIFFDHAELLYVNVNHHRGLAEKYALKAIDPFQLQKISYNNEPPQRLSELFDEASRIIDQDPFNYGANRIFCNVLIVRGQQAQALPYADNIIRQYPDYYDGYVLKADALFGMGRYADAERLYIRVMDLGKTDRDVVVPKNLHATYMKLNEYEKAYKLLSRFVNPFDSMTDYKDIYELGMTAACVDKISEAVTFLKIAKMKVPSTDVVYMKKIDAGLSILQAGRK
jgi:tetratricopeptide (TPR) repeat protein